MLFRSYSGGSNLAARVAPFGAANLSTRHRLRPAIARGFLLRRLLVIRRAFRTGPNIERDLDANPGEHRRNRSDDGLGILSLLVQGDGQTPFKAAARGGAEAGRLKRAHRSPEDVLGYATHQRQAKPPIDTTACCLAAKRNLSASDSARLVASSG